MQPHAITKFQKTISYWAKMKNCIIDLISTEVKLAEHGIVIDIIGAEDFEAAIYCFFDNVKEDVIWYSKVHQIKIPRDKFEGKSTFQAQVFLRFDKEDVEVKSFKSETITLSESPVDHAPDNLVKTLFTNLATETINPKFSRSENPIYTCNDKETKVQAYEIFFEKIHELNIKNIELFNFSVIDGFYILCNSSYGWKGEHASLGIPPVSWYDKLECDLDYHYSSGNIKHHVYSLIKGVIASVLEEWDTAEKFLANSNYPLTEHMGHFLRGSSTFRHPIKALREQRKPLNYFNVINVESNDLHQISHSYKENIFIFSAEPNYFNKFSLQVVGSALEQKLDVDFLFFIIGDQHECCAIKAEIDSLCAEHSRNSYYIFGSTSHELLPVAATARFVAAYEILRKTNCQAFVFDIDMIISPAMAEDIKSIAAAKELALSLKSDGARSFPWTNIAAAGTFLPQSAPALFFTKSICDYFVSTISHENNNWWIDQNALFAAYKQLKAIYYSHTVFNMHATTGKGLTQNSDADLLKWKRDIKKTSSLT